jgi:hypothetical protein
MILKGSQRGGAAQLARHLLNGRDNDHIEVQELRGFMASDLAGAFQEAHAISRGTRCRQFLFSVSLNPPQNAIVSDREFQQAAREIERALDLTGQPRAVVIHEKDGRRHAHCVWSRIDHTRMKAINLPYFKTRLRDVSRELYLRHGWRMPEGLIDSKARDPLNFTREEWQQALRADHDPKALKAMFQECWAVSDTRAAFAAALAERGYTLARGDRRGYVAVDFRGEVYAVARYTGQRTRDVADKLGDATDLPSLEEAKARIAERLDAKAKDLIREAQTRLQKHTATLAFRKTEMRQRQRAERDALRQFHGKRNVRETNARAARLRRGLRGLWDWISGKHRRTRRENERDAYRGYLRDQAEKQRLVERQLSERRALQVELRAAKDAHSEDVAELHRDVAGLLQRDRPDARADFRQAGRNTGQDRSKPKMSDRPRQRARRRKRGPGSDHD